MFNGDALNTVVVFNQGNGAAIVSDLDTLARCGTVQAGNETFTTAPRLDSEASPEYELAILFKCLSAIHWQKSDPLLMHPQHGKETLLDQNLD